MLKYFGSIASSPGKTGKYYYSRFFQHYRIEAEYNPFKAESIDEVLEYLSYNQNSGFNISMPFKQRVINYLKVTSQNVDHYNSCNTIKIIDGELNGFNTDINGVLKIVSSLRKNDYVILLGNGTMGKVFAKALTEHEINFSISSPSLNNWDNRHENCDVLINCTSLGTSLNVSPVDFVNVNREVFDLAINGTKLREMCKSVSYVSGISFYREVFLEQFFIHTGIQPDRDYFDYLTKLIDSKLS
jgi:shikimate dehydrogenase